MKLEFNCYFLFIFQDNVSLIKGLHKPVKVQGKHLAHPLFQGIQTLLDRKDRMSMYSGLEVRVPFCDYRIAEYLYSVPWEYKDYEGHEKGLLRQAMQGVLPTEVLWRKKSPYPKTWNPAYLNAVSAMLRSAMQDPDAPLLRIAKRAALEQLLTAAETATPWYGQLMTTPQTIAWFVQLNYWLQKYRVELV